MAKNDSSPKRWSMGGVVTPNNDIVKPNGGFSGQSIEDAFTNLFGDISSNDVLNTAGDSIQADQLLLQYLIGEQNYDRTNPQAIANMLQGLGMSRAAALQAVSGMQGSESSVTPFAPQGINSEPIFKGIGAATGLFSAGVGAAVSLSSLPFDNRVKASTADLITNQNNMLVEQRQGLSLASAAVQAASNENFDFKDANATSLIDYLKTLDYAKSLVNGIQSNPYAFASLSHLLSDDYKTRGLSYEPDRVRAMIKQMHSAASLAESQSKVYPAQVRILESEAFVAECIQDLQIRLAEAQTNIATIQSNAAQSITDSQVSQANYNKAYYEEMLNILPTISSATLEEYSYRLAYLETLHDPEAFESERQSIISSNTYDAVVYTKLKMIEEFKSTELSDMLSGSDPQKIQVYKDMVREGIALMDLYGADIHDDQHKWIRDIATGLGIGIGAYGLFSGKGRSPRTSYRNTSYRGNPYNVPVTPM